MGQTGRRSGGRDADRGRGEGRPVGSASRRSVTFRYANSYRDILKTEQLRGSLSADELQELPTDLDAVAAVAGEFLVFHDFSNCHRHQTLE